MQDKDIELRQFFYQYIEKNITKIKSHPEYNINKNNYHLLSNNYKLAYSVFEFFSKLDYLISDLDKIEIFIRRFPNKKFYNENDINEISYIKYHYEVFMHKIHTILEIMKLTINRFYNIGLKEKDCNWKSLKKEPKIKNTAISKIIEFYFKTFEHIIEHRNLNTHRGQFHDKKNDELRIESFLHNYSEKYESKIGENLKKIIPDFYLNFKIKKYKTEKLNYIKDGTKAAKIYVNQFETIILNEFFYNIINKKKS